MHLKLKKLSLENFAGIKQLELNFNGQDAVIFGKNKTGKTSTANAITWLLFGKDIDGNSLGNQVVPLDEDSNPINELTPIVEATFDKNGETITLRKERRPDKEKVDGSARIIFKSSGKTHAFIDEVPYPIRKYEAYINEIITEDLFKLLTSVNEFANLGWKEKREILFSITGEVTDKDVIETNSELAALNAIIDNNKSIEEERAKYKAQLKKAKDELEYIPIEIQTLTKQLPQRHSDSEKKTLEDKQTTIDTNINELLETRTLAQNGATEIEIKNEITNIKFELEGLERNFNEAGASKVDGMKREIAMIESDIEITKAQNHRLKDQTQSLEKSRDGLRIDWKQITTDIQTVKESQFVPSENSNVCDCCGQELPQDQIEAHKEKEAARFNEQKSKKLTQLEVEMNQNKREGIQLTESITENEKLIEKRQKQIEDNKSRINLLQRQVSQAQKSVPDVKETEEYKTLQEKLTQAEKRLENIASESHEKVQEIEQQLAEEREQQKEVQSKLAEIKQAERMTDEIQKLEQKENDIRDVIEDLTYKLHLLQQFEITKVNLITDKVNEKFDFVKFKMFKEKLTDGELEETCQILVNGVPYDKGLNNGDKIKASLDIINTLGKHYNAYPVIFIDNSESVTDMYQTEAQQVQLVVSKADKELRMELI